MHDTVEDTETTYDELVSEFGKEVADVVMEVRHRNLNPKAELLHLNTDLLILPTLAPY